MQLTYCFVLVQLQRFWIIPLERVGVRGLFGDVGPFQRCEWSQGHRGDIDVHVRVRRRIRRGRLIRAEAACLTRLLAKADNRRTRALGVLFPAVMRG